MKKGFIFSGLVVVLALCIFAPHAGAQMTSPYLVGNWEMNRRLEDCLPQGNALFCADPIDSWMQTQLKVINPTTTKLDVYIVLLDRKGVVMNDENTNTPMCYVLPLDANETWNSCWPHSIPDGPAILPPALDSTAGPNWFGTIKVFAFPYVANRSLKMDPNAVVAGYEQKSVFSQINSESDLKAVVINSRTIGEFTKYNLSPANCRTWSPAFTCLLNQGQFYLPPG
jgi:hypothetical protein